MRDALGRPFSFPSPPRRVVSLVPSLTETLFDLGAGDSVVAVTDFCIFPENLPQPRVGGTKNPEVEGAGPSRDWLQFVNTPKARTKIRQWFSRERRVDAIDNGREELAKA